MLFGLSGAIVQAVNRDTFRMAVGGKATFALHSAIRLLSYRGGVVRLIVDDIFDEIVTILTVAIANGTNFGGDMAIAPDAKPDDGLFDVVVIRHGTRRKMLRGWASFIPAPISIIPMSSWCAGAKSWAHRWKKQRASLMIETDGEAIGKAAATLRFCRAP